jgi:hypothetical protein
MSAWNELNPVLVETGMTYTGSKYDSTTYKTAAEIAKLIRADIRSAITKGDLPGAARNYSVRIENYSGGRSINVLAKGLPGAWREQDPSIDVISSYDDGRPLRPVLTNEGARIERLLQSFHDAYNYDHGDPMTDYFNVNYYGHARIERER